MVCISTYDTKAAPPDDAYYIQAIYILDLIIKMINK